MSARTRLRSLGLAGLLALATTTALAQTVGAPLDASVIAEVNRPIFPRGEPAPADLEDLLERNGESIDLDELSDPDSSFYRRRGTFAVPSGEAQIIQAAARGVGLRGGFAYEAERINRLLMAKYRPRIERSYPFAPLMLQDQLVVPPVITRIANVRELNGPNYLYLSNGAYEIVRPPRLTTQVPSWMDWLLLPVRDVRPPRDIDLKGAPEKALWRTTVVEAWEAGVREARQTFSVKLATLDRDYKGMRLYHQLANAGAIRVPRIDVNRVPWRVTPDGQRAFEGEVTLEIVVGPEFRRR